MKVSIGNVEYQKILDHPWGLWCPWVTIVSLIVL
nr:MAG TPA: contryphan [Caudoviricetes sp.]